MTIHRVLFATDFSEASEAAFGYATSLARPVLTVRQTQRTHATTGVGQGNVA